MAFGLRCTAYGAALITLFAQLARSQTCTGQSCIIADVSGSSGIPFTGTVEPVYPQQGQECCIIHYNPAVKERLYQLVPSLAQTCPTAMVQVPMAPDLSNVQCKPKVLIFAAGTSQDTTGGGDLGIDLQGVLGSNWYVQGVNYANDNDGNNCAGIPGGITAKNMLAAYATRCPQSALFVGGYSQGATVAHNAVGNSTYANRVQAVLTFGDPFNGAPIKGYSRDIHTICNPGDLVCSGLPRVLPAHLQYGLRIDEAARYLNSVQISSGAGTTAASSATATATATMTNADAASSSILASFSSVLSTAPEAASATAQDGGAAAVSSQLAAASSYTRAIAMSSSAAASSFAATATGASGNAAGHIDVTGLPTLVLAFAFGIVAMMV